MGAPQVNHHPKEFHSGPLALFKPNMRINGHHQQQLQHHHATSHSQPRTTTTTANTAEAAGQQLPYQDSDRQLEYILHKINSNPKDNTNSSIQKRRNVRQVEIVTSIHLEGRDPSWTTHHDHHEEEEKMEDSSSSFYTSPNNTRYEMDDTAHTAKVFMSLRREKMNKRNKRRQRVSTPTPFTSAPTPTPTPMPIQTPIPIQAQPQPQPQPISQVQPNPVQTTNPAGPTMNRMISEFELTRDNSYLSMSSCSLDSALENMDNHNPWLNFPPPPPPPPRNQSQSKVQPFTPTRPRESEVTNKHKDTHEQNKKQKQKQSRTQSHPKMEKLEHMAEKTIRLTEEWMGKIFGSCLGKR